MFRSHVKALMKQKKMTTRDIISATGLSSATVAKARQDTGIAECRLSTLGRLAQALEVSTKDLYGEEGGGST